MDFIFIKSSKAGKEDYGSIYARVRTGKANMKVVTGFTVKQLEWEKYRSLQYTSSALMSSIGIKYGQFAQVLARIKAAFEAEGFNPKEAKNIIESVKHDVLNGMMQIVEVKPKGRMLFDDFLRFCFPRRVQNYPSRVKAPPKQVPLNRCTPRIRRIGRQNGSLLVANSSRIVRSPCDSQIRQYYFVCEVLP